VSEDEDRWARRIKTSGRDAASVVLSLSCGHVVLRRPEWQIPSDLMTDCEVCANGGGPLMYPTYEMQMLHQGEWHRLSQADTPDAYASMLEHLGEMRAANPDVEYRVVALSALASGAPVRVA
jgi:hypothetical protein